MDDFPYKRNDMSKEDVMKMFNNLRNYVPVLKKKNYRIKNIPNLDYIEKCYLPVRSPIILKCDKDDYEKYNLIGDYFTEECRMRARRYDQTLSPFDFWVNKKEEIRKKALEKYGNTNNFSLRETIYELTSEPTAFRPTVIVSMIKEFKPKKILDFSSGWGDRLIGAMSTDVDFYCGIDPNSCLHPKYEEIIKTFSDISKTKVTMIESTCENAEIPINDFDMVFTSPPYFNLEIYSNSESQSISNKTDVNDWYENFLLFSLKKVWRHIANNGMMIIIINNVRNKDSYVEKMIEDVNKFEDSLYLGLISYAELFPDGNVRSPQPIWIWRKKTINKDPPISITDIKFNDKKFQLISDSNLPGGTKQRAWRMFQNVKEQELVYAGPHNGFAQVALAISAKLNNKKFTVFLPNLSEISFRARMYGAKIIVLNKLPLKILQEKAINYAKKNKCYIVPFGLDNNEFKDALYKQLKDEICKTNIDTNKEFNIWLVAGSATLLNVLYKIFPKANFNVVQVGKTIWPDQVNEKTKIYIAPEKFYNDTKILPPYPSVASYDAKLWQFASKHGNDNDVIWNVASI